MLVGIHNDPDRGFSKYLERYEQILEYNGIDHERLDINQENFWERVSKLDLFIFHWGGTAHQHQLAPTIMPIIEKSMGIPCYPNMLTWWPYDDKVKEYYLLQQASFPVIPTWVFWRKEDALSWLEQTELPFIFKLKSGGSSLNVIMIDNKQYSKKLINKMFGRGLVSEQIPGRRHVMHSDGNMYKTIRRLVRTNYKKLRNMPISAYEVVHKNYVLFQRFLPGNTFDTRITVIDDKAFASRRHIRKNDFRASGSGNDDWTQDQIDQRCISLAFKISKHFGFQTMSYDFLYDQDRNPLVSEMSYASPDWTIWSCPGFWDEKLGWHEGHFWPQYCSLVNALNRPDLKQPDMIP